MIERLYRGGHQDDLSSVMECLLSRPEPNDAGRYARRFPPRYARRYARRVLGCRSGPFPSLRRKTPPFPKCDKGR
jgi:hypothetical protein